MNVLTVDFCNFVCMSAYMFQFLSRKTISYLQFASEITCATLTGRRVLKQAWHTKVGMLIIILNISCKNECFFNSVFLTQIWIKSTQVLRYHYRKINNCTVPNKHHTGWKVKQKKIIVKYSYMYDYSVLHSTCNILWWFCWIYMSYDWLSLLFSH